MGYRNFSFCRSRYRGAQIDDAVNLLLSVQHLLSMDILTTAGNCVRMKPQTTEQLYCNVSATAPEKQLFYASACTEGASCRSTSSRRFRAAPLTWDVPTRVRTRPHSVACFGFFGEAAF